MKRDAQAALQRAEGLRESGDLPAAIAELERTVALNPDLRGARLALGSAWLEAGEAGRAIAILSPLVKPRSAYRAAAAAELNDAERLRGLGRSPPGYVRHLFDQFSSGYDRTMVEDLAYCAPAILRRLADLLGCAQVPVDILDLGCGTGLAGEVFKPLARRLDGIDLSPGMIAQAKRKCIYHELTVAEVETFLGGQGRDYDLLVAADVLVYFGNLASVFAGAWHRLRTDGYFLFTVEKQAGAGYRLGSKRRYRHSAQYIRKSALMAGFDCMGIVSCTPRRDAGQPVQGLAVALRRLRRPTSESEDGRRIGGG